MKKMFLILIMLFIMFGMCFSDTFPIDKENCTIVKGEIDYIYISGWFTQQRADHNYVGLHRAYDIPAKEGTIVRAAKKGRVIEIGFGYPHWNSGAGVWRTNYGNYIIIKHNDGTSTLYGHLSMTDVKENEDVSEGQKIGRVGSTGMVRANGTPLIASHLHFELRNEYGVKINPGPYFSVPRDSKGIAFATSR